jgi:hypothetical protein
MNLRCSLYDAPGGGIGQPPCLLQPRVPSILAVAAAHRIAEHQQSEEVGKPKMSATQIVGPTFLALKRHPSLLNSTKR